MQELPNAPVERIIRKTGKRVGEDVPAVLARAFERYGREISEEASRLAEHAGRKTIKRVDMEMAIERKG